MTRQLLINGRVFDGEVMHEDCMVLVEDGRIADILPTDKPQADAEIVDLEGHLLTPGFIDLQVNGGGGVLFNDVPTLDALQTMANAHRAFGTTACLPTLITDKPDVLRQGIGAVESALAGGCPAVLGIHLEGPHLNAAYRGVHEASYMRAVDDEAFQLLCSLNAGVTLVTLAPETLPVETIRRLSDRGVIVFGGHSAATFDETRAALSAGLKGFTHLFNAMSPMSSRVPGMVGAALDDRESYVGIIADGFHVHPAMLRIAIRAKSPGRTCLVTDAMPTVGSAEKHFQLYGNTISAKDGRCVTDDGTLAGSDIGMIDAVRNAVKFGGVTLEEALRMASLYPARALGIDDQFGYLRPGYCANLLELDADRGVLRSWVHGEMQAHH